MIFLKKTFFAFVLSGALALTWLLILNYSSPFFFTLDDNTTYYLNVFSYNWDTLFNHHTIPLINFYQSLGTTHLAHGQTGVLYPPVYLSAALSVLIFHNTLHTVDLLIIGHLVAAVLFMHLLLREHKISPLISTFGSLIYLTFPIVITFTKAWVIHVYVITFLPLNFLLLSILIRKPSIKAIVMLALAKSLFFFAGYQEHFFKMHVFELLFILLVSFTFWRKEQIKKCGSVLSNYTLTILVTLLLILPLLLPMNMARQTSFLHQNAASMQGYLAYALTLNNFLTAQFLNLNGHWLFNARMQIYYVGFFLIAIFVSGILVRGIRITHRNNHVYIYSILAIISLLFSSSLAKYIYDVPFFNLFYGPTKHYFYFIFFLTVSSIFTLNTLSKRHRITGKLAIYSLLLLIISLNIIITWQKRDNAVTGFKLDNPPQVEQFNHITKDKGRVITMLHNATLDQSYKFLSFQYSTLFGFFHFGGYDTLISKINHELSYGLNRTNTFNRPLDKTTMDHLSSWSVRYFLTNNDPYSSKILGSNQQLELIYQDSNALIYENKSALPFVYDTDKPQQLIPITFNTNSVDIYPTNTQSHTLNITLAAIPNYHVYINDEYIGSIAPSYGPIQIEVPPYSKRVTIKYIDRQFISGVIISATTLLAIVLIFLYQYIKSSAKTKTHSEPDSLTQNS